MILVAIKRNNYFIICQISKIRHDDDLAQMLTKSKIPVKSHVYISEVRVGVERTVSVTRINIFRKKRSKNASFFAIKFRIL
jgi:hypothetical protein